MPIVVQTVDYDDIVVLRPFDEMISKFSGFKMASLNINSLCRHIDELRAIMTNQPLGILAINESKLGENDYNHLFSLEGYTIVRRDRNKYGRGVCIY